MSAVTIQPEALPKSRAGLLTFAAAYSRNPTGVIGLLMLVVAVIAAIFAPLLAPYDPSSMDAGRLLPPSFDHWMGTDYLGRDILSLILFGSRASIGFAFGAAAISFFVGTALGTISGYFGGWLDHLLSRLFEIFLIIPMLFLVILLSALFGSSATIAAIVVGATIWPANARIARAQVLTLKRRMFVRAARASGASHLRILLTHILPNGVQPLIINSALQVGAAVLLQASLSFIGLGDPDQPNWGQMLREAQPYLVVQWNGAVFPGLAIAWLVIAVSLIGDAINHTLNRSAR